MTGKHVFAAALVFVAVGTILAAFTTTAPYVDIGAAIFAAATWIVTPLRFITHKTAKTSLAAVGFVIHVVVLAAFLSAAGLILALLTLLFAGGGEWSWYAILAIAAFWAIGFAALAFGKGSQSRRRRKVESYCNGGAHGRYASSPQTLSVGDGRNAFAGEGKAACIRCTARD
jgi:hypothetical protein